MLPFEIGRVTLSSKKNNSIKIGKLTYIGWHDYIMIFYSFSQKNIILMPI